jgi:hypothetical protein
MRHALLFAASVLVLACEDPLVGSWEREDDIPGCNERPDFVVSDDLTGEGDYCLCTYDFIVEERDSERYRFDVDFEGVCGLSDGKYDCDMTREDHLDCHELGDFQKVGE